MDELQKTVKLLRLFLGFRTAAKKHEQKESRKRDLRRKAGKNGLCGHSNKLLPFLLLCLLVSAPLRVSKC